MLPIRPKLLMPIAAIALSVGCGGPLTFVQRLEGEWVGRPETAAERVMREWPRVNPGETSVDADDAEVTAAVAAEPPTDLEAAADVRVELRLGLVGQAEVTFGADTRAGSWSVEPLDARHALLEIEVAGDDDNPPERRRYDLEFLPGAESFVLRENGADNRFGRLLFTRPAAAGTDQPKKASDE